MIDLSKLQEVPGGQAIAPSINSNEFPPPPFPTSMLPVAFRTAHWRSKDGETELLVLVADTPAGRNTYWFTKEMAMALGPHLTEWATGGLAVAREMPT